MSGSSSVEAGAALRYDPDRLAERLTGSSAGGGAAVVEAGDVALAREVARRNGTSELRALLDLGYLSEDALADALAASMGVPRWRADEESAGVSGLLPREFMESNGVLVLDAGADGEDGEAGGDRGVNGRVDGGGGGGGAVLVVADPSDRFGVDALLGRLGPGLRGVAVGTHKEIARYLETHAGSAAEGAGEGAAGGAALDVSSELSALRELASEAPVIRFFNQAVERAMELGASDMHLERFDRRVSLRMRVDGVLVNQPPPPAELYEPLLCRIKIMGGLDIAERRRAQDGRVRLRLRGRNVDLRVSIVPTMYGQDAAVRIQDRQRLAGMGVEDLGFDPAHIAWLRSVARKSHGILLITGPTGSGKTTTLYSLLRELARDDRKVITVEDPVEYAMDGVNQIQVNTAVGLTFGTTLRHILRHDPDVILIGEIRDHETAEMAFQSALTGHMVLSTLHTNDVPSSFVRLIDMGVEPYLVNAAVEGVSAQRLVRKVCEACGNRAAEREGCRSCKGLGYRGRAAVMECSALTPGVKRCLLEGADESRIRAALEGTAYRPMRADAARLVSAGVTDEAEAARVLGLREAGDEDVGGGGSP